jgi:tetratricopeptide (TPR) repeat protein
MIKYFTAILIAAFCLSGLNSSGQVEKILKPVEINPPGPPPPSKPVVQKESDQQLASNYFRNRQYDKALILYHKLFLESNNEIFYRYYFYCLIELEEFKEAEKMVKDQIKKYPHKQSYIVDLGFTYQRKGDAKKANRIFEEAIDELPKNRGAVVELANAFLMKGLSEYAVQTYHKGKQLLKDYTFSIELGDLYRQVSNYSLMIEEYLNYADEDPTNVQRVQNKLQNALSKDKDKTISDQLRRALLVRVQRFPQKLNYAEMLLWLSVQEKDFEMAFNQAKSLDRRNNEEGDRIMDLASLCLANHNFVVAIEAYEYVLKKGKKNYLYSEARIGILNAKYMRITNGGLSDIEDYQELEAEYISILDEYGYNTNTIRLMQYLAHLQAFYLDKTEQATDLLWKAIEYTNAKPLTIAECKIELADILLFDGDIWEAKLLYAQVEKKFKHEPIGHEAKFKNAKLSFYIGEFDWAKAQLDVLKAATSKLIANDALRLSVLIIDNIGMDSSTVALQMFANADMLLFRNQDEKALETLDSIFDMYTTHPIFDEVLYKKAEIKINQSKYEEAIVFLDQIANDYSWDIVADDALFLLAGIYDYKLKDENKAMEYYQKILNDYPASLYVVEARKRFRTIRGDFDNLEEMDTETKFFYDLSP